MEKRLEERNGRHGGRGHFGRSVLVGDATHNVSDLAVSTGIIADAANRSHLILPWAVILVWKV